MSKRTILLWAACAFVLLASGCGGGRASRPLPPSPSPSAAGRTPSVPSVSVRKLADFRYDINLFNDMFLQHPVQPLGRDGAAWLEPSVSGTGAERKAAVRLVVEEAGKRKVLFEGDGNNWHLRSTPDGSLLSWLSWRGEGEEEHCVLVGTPASGEGEAEVKAVFPAGGVVLDYFWYDSRYLYALMVFDEDLRDVRLLACDTEKGERRELISTGGFPHLMERDTLGIPGRLAWSPGSGIGYFSACGALFAFQGATGEGGLFLDGGDLMFLTSPSVSADGRFLSFYAVPPGGYAFVNCEMEVESGRFCCYTDRRLPADKAAADFLFTRHNVFTAGGHADIIGVGNGVVSVERPGGPERLLLKVEKDAMSLVEAPEGFIVVTPRSLVRYRIAGGAGGFPTARWSAPKVRAARFPDFRTPEGTLRTYLAAFQRGAPQVWTVCHREDGPAKWVASVGPAVAARSLRMLGALRNYRRFKAVMAGGDKVVYEGELEVCGDLIGKDVFTLARLGGMWLLESIRPAEEMK